MISPCLVVSNRDVDLVLLYRYLLRQRFGPMLRLSISFLGKVESPSLVTAFLEAYWESQIE